MSNRNDHDSQQLQWLRARYRDQPSKWPRPVTPYRLGIFAYRTSAKIDDYGAHSTRWIKLFEDGLTAAATKRDDIANP